MNMLKDLGIDPYDGIIAAYLPPLDSLMEERYKGDLVVYAQDGVVIDMKDAEANNPSAIKWWRVRNAARELNMSWVEPHWSGAAGDFPFDNPPECAHEPEAKLYFRAFSKGPWIKLEAEDREALKDRAVYKELGKDVTRGD